MSLIIEFLIRASPSQMQRKSPCSTDKKVQSPAANGDTASRKRSHNVEQNQVGSLSDREKYIHK